MPRPRDHIDDYVDDIMLLLDECDDSQTIAKRVEAILREATGIAAPAFISTEEYNKILKARAHKNASLSLEEDKDILK